jgi:protein-tyrosine phosphatase
MHAAPRRDRRSRERTPFEVAWVELENAPGHLGLAMAPGRREPFGPAEARAEVEGAAPTVATAPAPSEPAPPMTAPPMTAPPITSPRRWERDLHGDLRRLRHVHHCDVLVSLLSQAELDALGIGELADAVAVHGFEHHQLPVRDGTVPAPEQLAEVLELIDLLREHLLAGRTLVLHCRAGRGRAGMLAALVVASLWELPGDAIARVRRAQPRAVETVQQEHYVCDTAFAWYRHHVEGGGVGPA